MAKRPAVQQRGNQPNQAVQQTQTHIQAQHWNGPLPPPAALEQFNQIIPNGAERIMAMVEQEQAHRMAHEKSLLAAQIRDARRAHWMGWTISITAIGLCAWTAWIGANPLVSAALVGLPIAAIVQVIVSNRLAAKKG